MSDIAGKVAAFLRRAIGREMQSAGLGGDRSPVARAAKHLVDLQQPPDSIQFRAAMQGLAGECDLFIEENAHEGTLLTLQLRVIELAESNETAREIAIEMLSRPPLAKLFSAILAQAVADGASRIRVCATGDSSIHVHCFNGGMWQEAMTVPASLWLPLRGFVIRAEKAPFSAIRHFLHEPSRLPDSVLFNWTSDQELELTLTA